MTSRSRHVRAIYIRNLSFGIEDGLVSTVGLLSGVAAAGMSRSNILLTGMVLIFVEAFSMAVGSLLSEHSTEEYEAKKEVPLQHSILAAIVMFFSYFLSGLIPILPYWLTSYPAALWISILLSLASVALFSLFSAHASHVAFLRKACEILVLTLLAIAAGVIIGRLVHF